MKGGGGPWVAYRIAAIDAGFIPKSPITLLIPAHVSPVTIFITSQTASAFWRHAGFAFTFAGAALRSLALASKPRNKVRVDLVFDDIVTLGSAE